MSTISLGTPARYGINNRVLFTSGPHRNRPGIVETIRPDRNPELYGIMYRFYLPGQRQLNGSRPSPKGILCRADQLMLVLDDDLSRDEFLALLPDEVTVRYFN